MLCSSRPRHLKRPSCGSFSRSPCAAPYCSILPVAWLSLSLAKTIHYRRRDALAQIQDRNLQLFSHLGNSLLFNQSLSTAAEQSLVLCCTTVYSSADMPAQATSPAAPSDLHSPRSPSHSCSSLVNKRAQQGRMANYNRFTIAVYAVGTGRLSLSSALTLILRYPFASP